MSKSVSSQSVACQLLDWIEKQDFLPFFDYKAKKLTVFRTVFLLLVGLLQKRDSLHDMTLYLKSARWLQKRLGLASVDPSALNRRVAKLPTEMLRQIYTDLVTDMPELTPPTSGSAESLYLLDSTEIKLHLPRGKWGFRAEGHLAVKLHTRLRFSPGGEVFPDAIVCTSASVADRDSEVLRALVTDQAGTYIMDRGYVNYARFAQWNEQGIRFVARLYANQKLPTRKLRTLVDETAVKEDAEVDVANEPGENQTLRRVTYTYTGRNGQKKTVIVLTNRWDLRACEVAELYRKRWRIETFFNDFKHRMNGAKLHTSHPRGVYNQLLLAAIAYVWMERVRRVGAPTHSIGEFIRLLALFAGESRTKFLDALYPKKTRSSRGRLKKAKRGRPRKEPEKLKSQRWIQLFLIE